MHKYAQVLTSEGPKKLGIDSLSPTI